MTGKNAILKEIARYENVTAAGDFTANHNAIYVKGLKKALELLDQEVIN